MSQKLLISITIGDIKSKVLEWFNNRMNTENMIEELNNKIKSIKRVSIYRSLVLTDTVGEQEKLFVYVEFIDKYEIGIINYTLQQIFHFDDMEWRDRTEIVNFVKNESYLKSDSLIFSHDFIDNMDISKTPIQSPLLNNKSQEKVNEFWDVNKNRLFQQQFEQYTIEENAKKKRKNIENIEKELRLSKLKSDPVNKDLYNEFKSPVNTIYKHRDARLKKEAEAKKKEEEAKKKEEEAQKAAEEARKKREKQTREEQTEEDINKMKRMEQDVDRYRNQRKEIYKAFNENNK